MNRLSLTARISLMFMVAVMAVAVIGALSFKLLTQHHFQSLDQHTLAEKLDATERILGQLNGTDNFEALRPQLTALLGGHRDLTAIISDANGRVLFAEPKLIDAPGRPPARDTVQTWAWRDGAHGYEGTIRHIAVPHETKPFAVTLILDVSEHLPFFEKLQQWFWVGLLISGIVSASLGWMMARSGLHPLRRVTAVAASISARSLKERIPTEPVPSELQLLVSSFNDMLDRLDDGFVRLSNFSADIAHELRTPLTNLMIHTEVVLSKKRNVEDYEENLHSNLDELKRMSRMIEDMLFLAKSDNGLIIPQQQNLAIEQIVERLLAYYEPVAAERNIKLKLAGSGIVQGDVLMLHRAISNLLSNALRFTPDGETIRVTVRSGDESTDIAVENPGEPIPVDQQAKLFDRFYRGDPARREGNTMNVGLGLAITRSIVEAHRGSIWCSSELGRTVFHMGFPHPNCSDGAG